MDSMHHVLTVAAWALLTMGALAFAAEEKMPVTSITMSAAEAFEQGQGAFAVRLSDSKAAVLYDRELVEDDGPGISADQLAPADQRAPAETIAGNIWIKKVLHVERPEAFEVRLYVPHDVVVTVNGKLAADVPPWVTTMPVRLGAFPAIPAALLKKGDNEIVVHAHADPVTLKIAKQEFILRNAPDRQDRPRRSFKSTDGGKSWQPIDGEYMIRLQLVQYVREGHFLSPVVDLAQGRDPAGPLRSSVTVKSVKLAAEAETPKGTSVELALRTGPSPLYEAGLWSDWQSGKTAGAAIPEGHRYGQWRAMLKSSEPLATPALRSVTMQAEVAVAPPPAWAAKVTVKDFHNEVIRYTSLPFEYEDPRHPQAVALREKYKLDEVVKDAKSEFEKFVMLRNWVAQQWKFQAPCAYYPAWDADDILTHKTGMCVQFAIVYMQCAISLGYQTRFVFGRPHGTGHEVCEIWSNEYKKWIYMDCSGNFHCLNSQTGVPLSLLEVHDQMLKAYYPDGRVAEYDGQTHPERLSDALVKCRGLDLGPTPGHKDGHDNRGVPRGWLYLWLMPRNNFYAHQQPVPLVQGFSWDWPDYIVWEDAQTPRQWIYRYYTSRLADRNWTINQVCFDAAWGPTPQTLAVQMGTVTPYLETFLVNLDGQGWKPSDRKFTWPLHEGRNRLEMRVRNTSGVEGPMSFVELNLAK
jgi:hypothetical protein